MSLENLSRRSIMRGAAVLPALAVFPASATVAIVAPRVSHVSQPTAIDLLWKQYQETKRTGAALQRQVKQLDRELERIMPKPHPSIVYSPANDADGLVYYMPDQEPHTFNHYIWAPCIETQLKNICGYDEHRVGQFVLSYERPPLTPEIIARRERLEARLVLSRQYEATLEQTREKLGLNRLNRKLEDRIWPRMSKLQRRIYSTPAATQSDLDIKLALYKVDSRDDWLSNKLLRDFSRLAALGILPAAAREAVQS